MDEGMSARDLAEFTKTVAQIGFSFTGFDGNGHPRYRHSSGVELSVSYTPSDYRSRRNELARMERIAGQKVPRCRSGRYTFKPATTLNVVRSVRERATGASVDDMVAEASQLRQRFETLTCDPSVDNVEEARTILLRYNDLRLVLETKHRIIPSINGVDA
jgi:hypothetical protein